jgi:hypothetical protein
MKCSAVMAFMSQIDTREEIGSSASISPSDLDYLSANGFVLRTTKEDHDRELDSVNKLSLLTTQLDTERSEEEQTARALQKDTEKEHSVMFRFEGGEKKEELGEQIQSETAAVSKEEAELNALEADVNKLIQTKSMIDRMVPYGEEYLSLTDLGVVTLHDLTVRNYRAADEDFPDFLAETKATFAELRSIADRSALYVTFLRPKVPELEAEDRPAGPTDQGTPIEAPSILWSVAIGLAKLQGDTNSIGERYAQSLKILQDFGSTTPNKLMAAEIMAAAPTQDLQALGAVLNDLDRQLRNQSHVPKEVSAGVAATIMAGRRYDGTYPTDRFDQFKILTPSDEAAAILAVMNLAYEDLSAKFQSFRSRFASWGYMKSDDTEIASAFLAIGELDADEVGERLQYIVEQLKNYLEYPLVAGAILASIPVFESHEVLDLMEKAVTLLGGYARGLERSELVALAVRMIHGVRNELVKEIDSTAKMAETPVQFTYSTHPGFFIWYFPVLVAHSSYHATFSAMGGFHPAHAHGIGGFAG